MTNSAKPRIMFVDDDPMLLASTRRQLMMKLPMCELVFCGSGAEALAEAEKDPPVVIFSDVRMPEMDGPELLARIWELYPDAMRYALTGQTESDQQERITEVAHQVFAKPCSTDVLCEVIQSQVGETAC